MDDVTRLRHKHKCVNRNRDGARWRELMRAGMDRMWEDDDPVTTVVRLPRRQSLSMENYSWGGMTVKQRIHKAARSGLAAGLKRLRQLEQITR